MRSVSQDEVDVDGRLHFNRLAVEFVGLIAGSADCRHCGLGQHRLAAYDMRLFYKSLFGNDSLNHHRSLNVSHFCNRRVDGLDGREEMAFRDSGGNTNRAGWSGATDHGRSRWND